MNPGFYNISVEDVRAVHGSAADLVVFNGVRQFLWDFSIPVEGNPGFDPGSVQINMYGRDLFEGGRGMIFVNVATVSVGLSQQGSFVPNMVNRNIVAVWKAGQTVYELVAPQCEAIYIMQSIFLGRPGSWGVRGGEAELASIVDVGSVILPDGWSYRSRILDEDVVVRGVNGTVPVLFDNLRNAYSQLDQPFDQSSCNIGDLDGTTAPATPTTAPTISPTTSSPPPTASPSVRSAPSTPTSRAPRAATFDLLALCIALLVFRFLY